MRVGAMTITSGVGRCQQRLHEQIDERRLARQLCGAAARILRFFRLFALLMHLCQRQIAKAERTLQATMTSITIVGVGAISYTKI
jgi:hypothetical protein